LGPDGGECERGLSEKKIRGRGNKSSGGMRERGVSMGREIDVTLKPRKGRKKGWEKSKKGNDDSEKKKKKKKKKRGSVRNRGRGRGGV